MGSGGAGRGEFGAQNAEYRNLGQFALDVGRQRLRQAEDVFVGWEHVTIERIVRFDTVCFYRAQ